MSIAAVLLEGARRAALSAAMLFNLVPAAPAAEAGGVPPAAAIPPAPLAVDGSIAESGLTLAAHHFDVHVAGSVATVRTLLVLRNDGAEPVAAQYRLPYPARLWRGDAIDPAAALQASCDESDLSPLAAEQAETLAAQPLHRHDVLQVAPGEQLTVELQRDWPLERAGAVQRLRLPLPVDRDAPWVPRFTADVLVEAERPIRRLASPTRQALVDGIGERTALLSVPDGFVYRQTQLTVEFELDAAPPLALGGAAASAGR